MGARIAREARIRGVQPSLDLLAEVHAAAMELRDLRADDGHDFRYLHPGRSALILLLDVGEVDAVVLAASMVVDSRDPDWVPSAGRLQAPPVVALREAVPLSGSPDLSGRLERAPAPVRRIALAERLDHLRHAHLWPEGVERREAHAEAERVYGPAAERTHPVLARRYAWWCRMFARRHLS